MPMIDVTSAAGTFADKPALTKALAEAMMRWEKVPPIDFFSANTAAFVHELPPDSLSNARGDANYIRVEILTPVGWQVLDPTRLAPRGTLIRISTGRDATDTAFATTLRGDAELVAFRVFASNDGDLPHDDQISKACSWRR